MIEKPFPIVIPPGLIMDGTEFERAGKWIDANMVRFAGPTATPMAIGGFSVITTSLATPAGTPREALAWWNVNGGAFRIVVGTSASIYVIFYASGTSTLTNVTPTAGVVSTSGTYSFDTRDDLLYITKAGVSAISPLWVWNPATFTTPAAPNAAFTAEYGNVARGVVVTPESFVMVITDDREIAWASQGGHGTWAPDTTNTAGSLPVPTGGKLLRGMVVGSQTLLFTTEDLWAAEYLANDLVYGVRNLASGCGLIGPNAAVAVGETAYWMGETAFYVFDGFMRQLACPISDEVFGPLKMNRSKRDVFFAKRHQTRSEIWFHYASPASSTPDKVAIYNYENQTWTKGDLDRAASTNAEAEFSGGSTAKAPIMIPASGTQVYLHDLENAVMPNAYLESGRIPLLDGSRLATVNKFFLDGAKPTDTVTLGHWIDDDVVFGESMGGVSTPGTEIDVRFKARHVSYRQVFSLNSSRVGVPKLGVIESGTR